MFVIKSNVSAEEIFELILNCVAANRKEVILIDVSDIGLILYIFMKM